MRCRMVRQDGPQSMQTSAAEHRRAAIAILIGKWMCSAARLALFRWGSTAGDPAAVQSCGWRSPVLQTIVCWSLVAVLGGSARPSGPLRCCGSPLRRVAGSHATTETSRAETAQKGGRAAAPGPLCKHGGCGARPLRRLPAANTRHTGVFVLNGLYCPRASDPQRSTLAGSGAHAWSAIRPPTLVPPP